MFYVVTMLTRSAPLGILRSVESLNGFEAWRRLVRRYDGGEPVRQHQLLQQIMRPKEFPHDLMEWEAAYTARYTIGTHVTRASPGGHQGGNHP